MLSLHKVFFRVSAESWIYIAENVGTSRRQTRGRFTSTIHGLASPFLLLLFFLYSLSYKRCALSFNNDKYLIPLYFLFFLWFQCTSNPEQYLLLSFLVFLMILLCALSFNCDKYLIPLYFLLFLWFQCTSNPEQCFFFFLQ